MRAIVQEEWGGTEVMRLTDVAKPEPVYGEVLVKVAAASVNPVDTFVRRGLVYTKTLNLPFINGWDVAGVVEEVGYGTTRFKPGDRVFGMPWFPRAAGAYSEYVTAPARHFAHMPDGLGFTEAAAVPLAGLTAWQMLVDVANTQPGQRVLVSSAAGGVGHLAVQIAKSLGAHVIGVARAAKHDFLRALGADETVDYTTTRLADVVNDADVVIQMYGGTPGREALECLRSGGILVSGQGAWTPGLMERASELGVRASAFLVEPSATGMDALARLIGEGALRAHVEKELALEEAAEAHRMSETASTTGKIVLNVNPEL